MSEQESGEQPRRRVGWGIGGWRIGRQRVVELAVVVFGVMIALGLENLVEEIRLRGDAHELEVTLRQEILAAILTSWERQVIAPCLDQRLTALTAQANAPDGRWQAAPTALLGNIKFALPQPYRAPSRPWSTATFDRAIGSEAFKRIPLERVEAYAGLFYQIGQRGRDNAEEYFATAGLAPLAFAQDEPNAEVRAEMLRTLALLDRHRGLALIQADQIIGRALSMPGGADIRAEILANKSDLEAREARSRVHYGECIDRGATERLLKLASE